MKSRVGRSAAGLLCAVGLTACGGDSPSTPTITTPSASPALVTSVLMQGSRGNLKPDFGYHAGSFSTTAPGRLDVTVDWTFATNDVDIHIVRGTCPGDDFCLIVFRSESLTAKPEKLTVSNLDPGTYSLIIGNNGPTTESVSYQIVHTR